MSCRELCRGSIKAVSTLREMILPGKTQIAFEFAQDDTEACEIPSVGTYALYGVAVEESSAASMPALTSAWANSAATRMPFMTAFSLEEP